jgi:heme o synthase
MIAAESSTPLPADWRDLFALTKPRVMSLVVFTALCGLLASRAPIDPVLGFTAILAIALGAGGARGPPPTD